MRKGQKWLGKKVATRVRFPGSEKMSGSTSRKAITFHLEGVTRPPTDPANLARYVNQKRIPYHLIWEPRTGKWAQMIPFDHAARSMKGGGVDARGHSSNRSGKINIQICIAGAGNGDWSRGPLKNAWVIAEICRVYGIPRRVRKKWTGKTRSAKHWNNRKVGIHGHCHGRHDDHIDPGPRLNQDDMRRVMRVAKKQNKRRRAKKKK